MPNDPPPDIIDVLFGNGPGPERPSLRLLAQADLLLQAARNYAGTFQGRLLVGSFITEHSPVLSFRRKQEMPLLLWRYLNLDTRHDQAVLSEYLEHQRQMGEEFDCIVAMVMPDDDGQRLLFCCSDSRYYRMTTPEEIKSWTNR